MGTDKNIKLHIVTDIKVRNYCKVYNWIEKLTMAASRALFRQFVHVSRGIFVAPSGVVASRNITSSKQCCQEEVTHTGQKYDEEDWKKVRFVDGKKLVNKNIAIDLVAEDPPIEVDKRIVYCDGGGEPGLGHPKVFINLDKPGAHACGYCGLRFIKKSHH